MTSTTKSPENQRVLQLRSEIGIERLGLMSSQAWHDDPKSLLFSLSRYKFVGRVLAGKRNVLEVGCGDGFYSRIVQQNVQRISLCDHDPILIEDILLRNPEKWKVHSAFVHDFTVSCTEQVYDGIYLLDVLEHIKPELETRFLGNIVANLTKDGILIIGMPSIESQEHASEISKMGHVNCKSGEELRQGLRRFFANVVIFSMNDEVVHTGFYPMAHYLIGVCSGKLK